MGGCDDLLAMAARLEAALAAQPKKYSISDEVLGTQAEFFARIQSKGEDDPEIQLMKVCLGRTRRSLVVVVAAVVSVCCWPTIESDLRTLPRYGLGPACVLSRMRCPGVHAATSH